MIYIETNKQCGNSLSAELREAGLPSVFGITTRRIVDGSVVKGHPRAFQIDAPEGQRDAIQAILGAHVPDFGNIAKKISGVKAEARKRIDEVAPVWKQANALRKNPNDPIFSKIDAIREKSDLIEAHLATLTDAEAGAYDIENSPLWD